MRACRLALLALLAVMLAGPAIAQDDASKQIKRLESEFQSSYNKLLAEYRAEEDAEKKQAIVQEGLPELYKSTAQKFSELAEGLPEGSAAIEAWVMVANYAQRHPDTRQLAEDAKEKLLSKYINDEGLAVAVAMWSNDDEVLEKLAASTNRQIQGLALYFQMSKAKGRELNENNVEKVKPMMDKIVKEFGDVKLIYPGGREMGTLGGMIENELFAFENLRIGKVAPEIEGEDTAGVNFKLTDYRGKVVVIDFWGDW